ncbi:MAG: Fur family transcriptional regulator [Chloroflexota bacterium]
MPNVESLISQMRDAGERITPQRRLVLAALCAAPHQHHTINDIIDTVAASQPSRTLSEPTVYRILQWLKNGYWVAQTDMAGSGTVYQLISDPPHHHLICLECGQEQMIDDDLFSGLRQTLQTAHQFSARLDHMALYGVCEQCNTQSNSNIGGTS